MQICASPLGWRESPRQQGDNEHCLLFRRIRGRKYLESRKKLVISRYIFRKCLQNVIRMQLCFWNLHHFLFFYFFYSSRKKFTSFPAILLENFQNLFRVPNSICLDRNSPHIFLQVVSALSSCSKNINFYMIFYVKVGRSSFSRGASQKASSFLQHTPLIFGILCSGYWSHETLILVIYVLSFFASSFSYHLYASPGGIFALPAR